MTVVNLAAGAVLIACSLVLFVLGLNLLYLSLRALRLKPQASDPERQAEEALVCVQLPIYNERYVAERIIDAACRLDWPRDRLQVQVLDDSDDETSAIVAQAVARWRRRGVRAEQIRRPQRSGYKAGALAHGMRLTSAEYLAVFDADFVPPPDFLRRIMVEFEDPGIGFAQARWGHLNEGYSWLTRLQALILDFHFLVEHPVRARSGFFTNFTGTAGVWRRAAIVDAGGWSAATLTEDLDLSYRAQLRGWRPSFREDIVVPEELPVEVAAYRRQQMRWATGSFQVAFRLLPAVLRSQSTAGSRWQATVQLLSYAAGPIMLAQLATYPVLLLSAAGHGALPWPVQVSAAWNLLAVAPTVAFMVAQHRRGLGWWRGAAAVFCQAFGAGLCLTALRAVVRARRGGGEFIRTPKYRIEHRHQEWRDSEYVRMVDPQVAFEIPLAASCLVLCLIAWRLGSPFVAVYAGMFSLGLGAPAALAVGQSLHVATLRGLGRSTLARLRRAAPIGVLLTIAGLLLAAFTLIGLPYEDSYQHWLVAAYLAQTGSLHDPLFGMQDTWLPGYHLLAAGLLKVFGLWQLGVLRAASAGLGLLTLAAIYCLAETPRQGRRAVALLALNPIFLLTATSVVAEPLTTALLSGAALAALRRRLRLAGLALAGACFTATKAWIWVAALLGVALLQHLLGRRYRTTLRPALAWAIPALTVLGLMQLAFAPASHSMARAAIEVSSATARGSLPGSDGTRLAEFAGYFVLASLPLVALAPLGLWHALQGGVQGRSRARLLYLPALAYLGVVVALVAAGSYSGSHRYYYPALPALALLAAGGLERGPGLAAAAATAGAGLALVFFVPLFGTLAGENAGLLAAGRASGAVPGSLLTDSPVAAYSSHKAPADIVGSRSLPGDRAASVSWLRQRGVTSLVLEDIDYYRATTVLPELVAGRAQAPFSNLGSQADYTVSGGKTAYAYTLTVDYAAALGDGLEARLGAGTPDRGLMLTRSGASLAGGGVGLGMPRLQTPAGWLEPDAAELADLSSPGRPAWRKTYSFGAAGRVEVVYRPLGSTIQVSARALDLAPGVERVAILNQESGAFDDFADTAQTLIGEGFQGSHAVAGSWSRLRSDSLQAQWSVPALPGAELAAERGAGAAGLNYIFTAGFSRADYTISVERAR